MKNEVIVLGGGVGGLPVANRLVRARSDIRVTLIDSHGDHVYQAGSMNVALDGARADRLRRDTRDLLDPRVTLRADAWASTRGSVFRMTYSSSRQGARSTGQPCHQARVRVPTIFIARAPPNPWQGQSRPFRGAISSSEQPGCPTSARPARSSSRSDWMPSSDAGACGRPRG